MLNPQQNRLLMTGLASGLAGALFAGLLAMSGALQSWEASTWDMRVRQNFEVSPHTDDIRIVLLDQRTLDWSRDNMGLSWPWYRESYAHILRFFNRAKPKAIVFDWIYSDPSVHGLSDDQAFVRAIEQTPGFVGALMSADHGSAQWPATARFQPLSPSGLEEWAQTNSRKKSYRSHLVFPIDGIRDASTVLGDVRYKSENELDSVVRHAAPFSIFAGQLIPSLGLGALFAEKEPSEIRFDNNTLWIDEKAIPLDANGQTVLRYRGPSQTHPTVSAAAVIQSEAQIQAGQDPIISPEFFRGKYIFFGPSAPGLEDLKPTPSGGLSPGVEMHATLLDNILSDDLIRNTPPWINLLYITFFAIFIGIISINSRRIWQSLFLFATSSLLPYGVGLVAYSNGYWLPVVAPTAAALSALLTGLALGYALEGRQRQFIKSAFNQYLSPEVIDKLIADPHSLKLGGELRELTIFFSDLKGFSTISEQLGPKDLTRLLNDYLSEMCDIILDEGGTIDKYEGDAIIAFWNAPLDIPNHAYHGVRAALRCQRRLAELRPKFKEQVGHELYARIGLNTGPVVVGNMGSRQRFDYTFLGDAGNLAARLEGANKAFASWVMISGATMTQAGDDFNYRKLARITVVGRKEAVDVYEPYFPEDYAPRQEHYERFHEAIARFQAGEFKAVLPVLTELASSDRTAAIYKAKCEELCNTPPQNWDGTWHLDTK